jgi:class 3 adenylate cyclase
MKYFLLSICLLFAGLAGAQSIEEMERQLKEAASAQEKISLYYQLGKGYLLLDADKAIDNAKNCYNLANQARDKGTAAYAAYLVYEGYTKKRKSERDQETWLKNAFARAKEAGDLDMVIKSISERSDLAVKSYDHRRAYQIHQEAFQYLSQQGLSANDLKRKIEAEKAQLDRERKQLQEERDNLASEINRLTEERDELNVSNSQLTVQQQKLSKAKERAEEEIAKKEEQLADVAKQKQLAEEIAEQKEEELKKLSRKELEQRAMLSEAELEVSTAQLALAQNRNVRNVTFLAAALLFLLSMLIYSRYRSSRKAKVALEEKNKIILQERERSDELLLNILPARIADELKEYGKAKARRYDEVTVLFTDFKNFSRISEQLTPEELVQELDNCFKAFDFIISQYPDIEKIKTVGDAYLCVSGLSENSEPPLNLIRAAQEMQQFLEEQKQEKRRIHRPYFEARIGLHTGPVVAGVVGVNKFAYDIWGDTVNIAARMEANSEPGKINISATTYELIKERYTCRHRGKVHAKNKGLIDMYFVENELAPVTA